MKYIILLGAVAIALLARETCGQNNSLPKRNQLAFTGDNNYFLFQGDDGYYTSGLFLKYDRATKNSTEAFTQFTSFEVGQMIFNAHSRKILIKPSSSFPGGIQQIDRPIAGYLFGKASKTSIRDRTLWSVGISAGCIGEPSLGRKIQQNWHRAVGIKDHWNWIWDYQVNYELGVNLHATFARGLVTGSRQAFVQVTPVSEATAGTSFVQAAQGVVFQVGKLRPMRSGSHWNAWNSSAVSAGKDRELFFYVKPQIMYQAYNATIQGGMFRSDKGPLTSEVEPWVFAHEVGVRFSTARYNLGYTAMFSGREARGQFNKQAHARLLLAYRF